MSLFDKKYLVFFVDVLFGCNILMFVVMLYAVNGYLMINVFDGMEIVIFVMGCFWGVECLFWQLFGVYSIVVGYIGGYMLNLIYWEVCFGDMGYVEVVCIVYDFFVISYEQLLQVFWENYDFVQGMCQGNDYGMQYCLVIYLLILEQDVAVCVSLECFQAVMFVVDDDCYIIMEIVNVILFYYVEDDYQ